MGQQLQLSLASGEEVELTEAVEKQLTALMAEWMLAIAAMEKETRHDHATS